MTDSKGGRGRCLRWDIAGTGLRADDRLEPSIVVPDVGSFEELESRLPLFVTFWRRGVQARVLHRNPLLDAELDITPRRLVVDVLHCLNLGTLKSFCRELLWQLMWDGAWIDRRGRIQDEWVDLSVSSMRVELNQFLDVYERNNKDHKITRIQQVTTGMVGTPAARLLKLKAAETKYFFYFLVSKIKKVSARIHCGGTWLHAATAMERFLRLLEALPCKISPSTSRIG